MKVAVVTPTIGTVDLNRCLWSVNEQTHNDIVHYVFIDGKQYFDTSFEILTPFVGDKLKVVALEDNVGKGWYGHRVYAACSFLVNADVICYLDEDNWYEPNHVQALVDKLQNNNTQWAYSLRKIYEGVNYICNDDCESLGKWPVFNNDSFFHVDTSCFAVRKDVATKVGHAWYGQWGADRQFFGALQRYFPNFECSGEYSLCYKVGNNAGSVTKEYFLHGNGIQKKKYPNLPWMKK